MANSQYTPCPLTADLRYYIVRGLDGAMVPLIPVDQLPNDCIPLEMPAQLSHRQISDENWKFVAETAELPRTLACPSLDSSTQCSSPEITSGQFLAPDHRVHSQSDLKHMEVAQQELKLERGTPTKIASGSNSPQSSHSSIAEASPPKENDLIVAYQEKLHPHCDTETSPSRTASTALKKIFCTYWIKTGACAFLSQGCKYKHEMPSEAVLHSIGFTQGTPRWWKEKLALTQQGQHGIHRRLANRAGSGNPGINSKIPSRHSNMPGSTTSPSSPGTMTPSRSPMTNLLIDLDDMPIPPSSPGSPVRSNGMVSATLPVSSSRVSSSHYMEQAEKVVDRQFQPITLSALEIPHAIESVAQVPRCTEVALEGKSLASAAPQVGLRSSRYAAEDNASQDQIDTKIPKPKRSVQQKKRYVQLKA